MELNKKTILITGGGSGIGLEAAKQFMENGAKVIISGRNQSKLDAAKHLYPNLTIINSDVVNPADAQSLFEQVRDLGGIDILYNNAGVISDPLSFATPSAKHFDDAAREINTNYLAVVRLNDLFMEMLRSRDEAAIINTTSVLSYQYINLAPTYSASKVAVRFYTDALRDHLKLIGSRVKVFEIAPPAVATDMADGVDVKTISSERLVRELVIGLKNDIPAIRVGDTKSVYYLARFLPSMAYKLVNTAKGNASLPTKPPL